MVSNHIVFVVSPTDDALIKRLSEETGLSKTELVRKALKGMEPKFEGSVQKSGRPKKSHAPRVKAIGKAQHLEKEIDDASKQSESYFK